MGCLGLLPVLLALVLVVAVLHALLKALPWILIAVGVGLLVRWYRTRPERVTSRRTNVLSNDQGELASADTVNAVSDALPRTSTGGSSRRQLFVRRSPDAVHDAIEQSLAAVGAKIRWDGKNPRHVEGTVREDRLFGAKRYIDVTFGQLREDGCWVSVTGNDEEMQAQFERALGELVGPTWDLVDEYEGAWCSRFNEAMTRQGDPTRIYPRRWICPNCGAAGTGGALCGRCGAQIEWLLPSGR